MPRIAVEHVVGRAADFHAREMPHDQDVHIWWFEPEVDAVVLGSTQEESVIDREVCRRLGVDVVRRRSGGGLVFLSAEGTLWLDVVLPIEHPLWDRDVTSASFWLGEIWMEALASCGVHGLVQHRSRLERTAVSDLVCFVGRGPGEVFVSSGGSGDLGSKVVGISQRRTRTHARFQTVVSLAWEPDRLIALLADPVVAAVGDSIACAGSTIHVDRARLVDVMTTLLVGALRRERSPEES